MQGSASDQGVTRLAIQDVFTNIEKVSHQTFVEWKPSELMGRQHFKFQVEFSVDVLLYSYYCVIY